MTAMWMLVLALAGAPRDPVILQLEHLTNCGGWKVTIHISGQAEGKLIAPCSGKKGDAPVTIRRSLREHVAALQAKAQEVPFERLPDYDQDDKPILDDDVYAIEFQVKGSSGKAVASGRQVREHEPAFREFEALWHAVDELVPEPQW